MNGYSTITNGKQTDLSARGGGTHEEESGSDHFRKRLQKEIYAEDNKKRRASEWTDQEQAEEKASHQREQRMDRKLWEIKQKWWPQEENTPVSGTIGTTTRRKDNCYFAAYRQFVTEHEMVVQMIIFMPLVAMALYIKLVERGPLINYP